MQIGAAFIVKDATTIAKLLENLSSKLGLTDTELLGTTVRDSFMEARKVWEKEELPQLLGSPSEAKRFMTAMRSEFGEFKPS